MIKPYVQDINDIIIETEYLAKGRALPIGTVREWSGGKYVKTASGWEPYTEGATKTEAKPEPKSEFPDIQDAISDKTPAKVQDHEIEAIKEYQSGVANSELGGYTALNEFMRTGKPKYGEFTPEDEKKARTIIDAISNAISKHQLEKPSTFYRGLKLAKDDPRLESWQNMKPGSIVSDKAFMSATTSKAVASKFSEKLNRSDLPVSVEISMKAGDKALPMNKYSKSKENEILLDRNQKFKVLSTKTTYKGILVKMEAVD